MVTGRPGTSTAMDSSRQNFRASPAERRATNLSSASSAMSFGNLPSGTWDVRFHGSCPKCHHWHNKMTLRLSRLPGVYNGVRCENCSYKWFGLGGNSTHTSLVSQQTRSLTLASDFSGPASSGPTGTGDASAGAATLITRLHSMSAVGSPFLTTCTVPQRQEEYHDNQHHEDPRPTSRLRAHLSSSTGRDTRPLSMKSSRSSRGKEESAPRFDQAGPPLGSEQPRKEATTPPSKRGGLVTRLRGKVKAILCRIRRHKTIRRARQSANCQSVDTTPATTTENSHPVSVPIKHSCNASGQKHSPQQSRVAAPSPRSTNEDERVLTPPPIRRRSAPEPQTSSVRSDIHGDNAYKKPFSYPKRSNDVGHTQRDEHIREIRQAKTLAAQHFKCECPTDCHWRRPTSSLIPDNPLTDRASLYHLDLAQPSAEPRIVRDSADLAHIGSHLISQLPNISEPGLSLSSSGSIRGRSESRRGRDNLWRRSTATSGWESQGTTAYTDSDAGSSTPRRTSYHRHDLLLVGSAMRSRGPSPLASPTNVDGFNDGDDDHNRRRSGSVSSIDEDYPHSERGIDGIPSVSPIQETVSGGSGPVSTLSLDNSPDGMQQGPRISVDVAEDDDDARSNHLSHRSSSSQLNGPLNSHPLI